jgi:hypothetical protein
MEIRESLEAQAKVEPSGAKATAWIILVPALSNIRSLAEAMSHNVTVPSTFPDARSEPSGEIATPCAPNDRCPDSSRLVHWFFQSEAQISTKLARGATASVFPSGEQSIESTSDEALNDRSAGAISRETDHNVA